MLHKLSVRISEHFKKLNILQAEQEIYTYGIELILGDILNLIILLFVACLLNRISEMAIWSIVFLVSKKYTGGYHAPSHLLCILTLQSGFMASYLICEYLSPSAYIWFESAAIALGLLLPAVFGPVGSYKKPISLSLYKKKKKILYIFITIFTLILLSILFLVPFEKKLLYAYLAYLFDVIFIPAGYIDNKIKCGAGSGIDVQDNEVNHREKARITRSSKNIWKENREIVNYVTYIYENNNPFERTWAASYELPFFVLYRINKTDRDNEAENKSVNNRVNHWCAFVNKHLK